MENKGPDKEYLRMLEAFSLVSSMAFMTVFDFLLAYFGGNWLDEYFQTGDHTWRTACICLAVTALFFSYYRLVTVNLAPRGGERENELHEGQEK